MLTIESSGPTGASTTAQCKLGRGFSLIELIVVVVIIAVVGAVALPRFSGAQQNSAVEQAATRVVRLFESARQAARRTSTASIVHFDVEKGSAEVVVGGRVIDAVALWSSPYQASICSADFGGQPRVTVDHYGLFQSGGTVVIMSGSATRTIEVGASGGIEVR